MQVHMQKWGNSLAVRVPKAIAEHAKLAAGDALEMNVDELGVVRLQRATKMPTLEKLVAQITPENRYTELSWGVETKRESVEW